MTKDKALKLALDFVASISPAFICEATHHKKNERHADNEPCPHVKKQKQTYEAIKEAIKEALAQPEYRAVKTYHEGKPVYVAQPEQPKYRRGSRVICLETEEYCVIHISGTDRQWVKFPDSHIGVYTNEQVAELFELLPKEQPQPEQNLNCKSVQARLATAWGYVKAQSQQEPVAWMHNFIEGGISIGSRPADLERHPDRWTALFKDPKPCPTCEALARTVMLDQTSHDNFKPDWDAMAVMVEEQQRMAKRIFELEALLERQTARIVDLQEKRVFVGLTDEEAVDCWPGLAMYADCAKFWENIEALLKEKNEH